MESEKEIFTSPSMAYNGENAKNIGKKILKPIRQEKIVKVPVTQYVEKIIEKEEIKYVNKYVDVIKPIITYKTKHIPKPIYLDKIKYETKVVEKEKIIHIPKIEYKNKIVEVPVYVHREKIIEKKVPMVIERVIPILKTKKMEKSVLSETIALPEVSELTQKNINIKTNVYEQNKKITVNKFNYTENTKISEDTMNNKNRSNSDTYKEEMNSIINTKENQERNKQFNGDASVNSNMNEEENYMNNEMTENKNEEYEENMNEEINYTILSEENKNNIINENYEKHEMGIEETINSEIKTAGGINTTKVSIHLPQHIKISESMEQKYMQMYNNNASLNNVMNNAIYENEAMFVENTTRNTKSISEQLIQNNENFYDPKIYSFPAQEVIIDNYKNINKGQNEMEYNNIASINMNMNSTGKYNTIQNIKGQITPSRLNIRPSYANANGQSFVSVRPATIVEYKSKKTKKAPMCNFLNRCCGGDQE